MNYFKIAKSIPDLIVMLKHRGLAVEDDVKAAEFLKSVSYFRLAAYLRPLEKDKQSHSYKAGSSLDTAIALYQFDSRLRMLIFSAIQTIEIALRSSIIQVFTEQHGPFWYLEERLAANKFNYAENLNNLAQELDRSKEDYIKEHYLKYGKESFPPAWKALELASFGRLSKLFFNFSDNKAKKKVAKSFSLPQHEVLESWMRSVGGLRNRCAHHNRLWNSNLTDMPQLPRKMPGVWLTNFDFPAYRVYAALSCVAYWLNAIKKDNCFIPDFKELLVRHPEVDVSAMGFPKQWEAEPLWCGDLSF
ncbi:MAG: Abi family protein [Bacteroidales bacterium]|nr:Abi family protein [Bacteroidales bacterium]